MKRNFAAMAIILTVTVGVISSCKKDENTLPPIGGFNSADEVGSANLVAKWGFEGTGKEDKSGATPASSVNASFTTGVKGQALNLAAGYLSFNEITALNSLPSFTVSAWVNVKNNGDHPSVFFTMTRPNEWAGNVNLMSETGWYKADKDTLLVKGLVVTKINGNASFQDDRNDPVKGGDQAFKGAGKWSHLVITWDGATSNFLVYGNGKKINNPEWEQRGTTGPLTFFTPTKAVIGAWGTNLPGGSPDSWQQALTGQIDELRVFNKALSAGDISSLYQLELAGR